MILPVLSAILGIIAFSPLNLYPLGFIYLVPLFVFYIRENGLWRLIVGTVIFKIILSLGTVYYTFEPFNWTWSILLSLGLPVAVYIVKKYTGLRHINIALPVLWIVFDHIQAHYSLLPIYIISTGNILGSSPFVGASKPFSIIGLTTLLVIVNILLTVAYNKKGSNRRTMIVLAVACAIGALLYSQIQLRKDKETDSVSKQVTIASVSTNKDFDFADAYRLERDLAKTNADIVVLPESMLLESANPNVLTFYQGLAKTLRAPVIASMRSERAGQFYISTVVIEIDGSISGTHDKTRLTFMGEYWPFKSWQPSFITWLSKYDPQMKSYAIFNPDKPYGKGTQNILTVTAQGTSIPFASLICMEIQYPYDLIAYKKAGARFIITPTSNRWLDIGSDQFTYLTNNLRTIESVWIGIPIITAGVNDGAGIITPDGKVRMMRSGDKRYAITISSLAL